MKKYVWHVIKLYAYVVPVRVYKYSREVDDNIMFYCFVKHSTVTVYGNGRRSSCTDNVIRAICVYRVYLVPINYYYYTMCPCRYGREFVGIIIIHV